MMEDLDPKKTIYPTFECFTDAMEFIDHIARWCPEKAANIRLVHAICANEQRDYAHAWVEDVTQQVCIFAGMYMGKKVYFAAHFEDFFKAYPVKETTRYTVDEAIQNNLRTINFGPWENKYIALCGHGEKTILGGGQMENVVQVGCLPDPEEKPTNEKGTQ